MERDRRFEVRQLQPNDRPGRVVAFGVWKPSEDLVLSCRLSPPSVGQTLSLREYLGQLGRDERLTWMDHDDHPVGDPTENPPA